LHAAASPVAGARSSGGTRVCRNGTSHCGALGRQLAPRSQARSMLTRLGRPARPPPDAVRCCRRGEWGLGSARITPPSCRRRHGHRCGNEPLRMPPHLRGSDTARQGVSSQTLHIAEVGGRAPAEPSSDGGHLRFAGARRSHCDSCWAVATQGLVSARTGPYRGLRPIVVHSDAASARKWPSTGRGKRFGRGARRVPAMIIRSFAMFAALRPARRWPLSWP
jgi:hypothetical protein